MDQTKCLGRIKLKQFDLGFLWNSGVFRSNKGAKCIFALNEFGLELGSEQSTVTKVIIHIKLEDGVISIQTRAFVSAGLSQNLYRSMGTWSCIQATQIFIRPELGSVSLG